MDQQTDRKLTDQQTNKPTDTPFNKNVWTQLKTTTWLLQSPK